MKPKSLFSTVVGVLIAFSFGCSPQQEQSAQNDSPSGAAPRKGRLFGVSFQSMNNPFFVDLNEGLKKVIEEHGDQLVTLDAQWNSLKQKNDISDLILKGASVIFLNPVNWEGVRGTLLQAQAKKIPIIVVDAPVKDQELLLTTVASDNLQAGRLVGEALVKAKSSATVAILQHSVNKAAIDRVAGFKEVLAKHPGMKIVDEVEIKAGTTESARPVMRDMIGRHPTLDAVFAINDPSALGAVSALESAGKLSGVKVLGVDGAQEALRAIQSGKMLATSAQFPKEIGTKAADLAYDHLAGKPVPKDVKVRVELITKENVASYLKPD
jgi:ribose transport system substrate-binding protein